MRESDPEVPIRAILGISSKDNLPWYLPSEIPLDKTRADVRLAIVIPSPTKRMMFFTFLGPLA